MDMREKIKSVVRVLERFYGRRPPRLHGDPLDGLIGTVLSQHTSDTNSDKAFCSLKQAFPGWKACMCAQPIHVEQAIRQGGLARQKTRSIQAILRFLHKDLGRISLDFMRRWPLQKARDYLLSMPGVGPKTAACVLLFYFGKPALPVDTHVHRISRRLGLITDNINAEQAHPVLEAACPKSKVYAFHVLLIEHGRTVCRARNPQCDECPIARFCAYVSSGRE